jgi:enterochelin esterase-like enzyme
MRRFFFSTLALIALACGASDPGGGATPGDPMADAGSSPGDAAAPDVTAPEADAATEASADGATETCTPRDTDAPPKSASYPMKLAGQDAWIHDEKSPAGYFHTFDAVAVGAPATPRKVHVFLPRAYPGSCKRYPVVYMNDGDTAFFSGSVGKSWDVQSVLASGYAAGTFGEVIVVAVHPLERDREYTHAQWLAGRSCCEVPGYTTYLAGALKPFIDGAYRTRTSAKDTTIAGSSHGGLAAFYVASTRPDVFGNAIAMSSSFWAGLDELTIGGPLASSALMQAAGPGLTAKKPRLYLDWGLVRSGGTHNAIIEDRATMRGREMATLLEGSFGYTKGKDLFTVEDPLGEHDELSWKRRFGNALKAVLGP